MAHENLTQALIAAQKEFAPLAKTATNPHFKNKFVPLHEVLAGVLPVLNKNGLALAQFPSTVDGDPVLTTYLLHESGEQMHASMPLLAAKNDPQGQGSAITYARRYAIMSILGVVGDEDDDGQKATQAKQAEPASQAQRAPATDSLEKAKARLRKAIGDSGVDAGQFTWVREEKSVKKINEAAQALENVVKGLNA